MTCSGGVKYPDIDARWPPSELIELQFAAERRLRAEEARKTAAAELRERVVDAYEAGIPVSRIARESRVSRQAVYEMLGLRRLSRPRGLKSCENRAVANPDRLTALDSTFLHLEDHSTAHMHVASVMVFEGEAPTLKELVDHVVSRLHLVPRYRQRLAYVPFGQGRPVWTDDPHFNPYYHIRHTALPKPAGEESLKRLAGASSPSAWIAPSPCGRYGWCRACRETALR